MRICRWASAAVRSAFDWHAPSGGQELTASSWFTCRGFEPERIIKFRDALGLSDEDAAAVHIDVGRRFSRQRQEAAKQADKSAQLKVLLIIVDHI